MKKNIFICHRPYHILRCCDLINRYYKEGCYNVLYTYDVKLARKNEYQRFEVNNIFYSLFDEVTELTRSVAPSVRSFTKFYKYCKGKRIEYLPLVDKHIDVDSVFFFADNELEVGLLVGLYREKVRGQLKSVLVDEGMVTYSEHHHSKKRRLWLKVFTIVAGIKYFNTELTYGYSNLYNQSLANNVERAVHFRPPVSQLPPLLEKTCQEIRDRITSRYVPDYDRPYFIYADTYEKSFQEDVPVIRKIKSILDRHNINFYIKLHPQQNEELYKREFGEKVLLEKGVPIELFFGKNSIIGGTLSSSLFSASLQGYKSIDFSYLFPEILRKKWVAKPITEQFDWVDIAAIKSYADFEKYIVNYLINNYEDRNNNTLCQC